MSAAKHTPGPWSVNDNLMAMSEYCILAESRGTGFGASVATANQREGYNSLSPEDAKANARLIAAAPELLEALKTMVKEFGYDVVHDRGMVHDEREAIRSAIDAIAKAEGATQ